MAQQYLLNNIYVLFKKTAYQAGIVGTSCAILYTSEKQNNLNKRWYFSLSKEQQRKFYNNCPEQILGPATDTWGVMFRMPGCHLTCKPIVPYEESIAKRLK